MLAFGLLPDKNDGDIWFDMEGDPFANNGEGLEYMFGYTYLSEADLAFNTFDSVEGETHPVSISAEAPIAAIFLIICYLLILCCYGTCHMPWQTLSLQR